MSSRFVVDLSLTLINRTGASYLSNDLVERLPHHFLRRRYWRVFLRSAPRGPLRWMLGKAMLAELNHPWVTALLPAWGRMAATARHPTLFLDPLYVLGANIDATDLVLCHDIGPVSAPHLFDPRVAALYAKAYERIRARRPGMIFVSEASRNAFVASFGNDYRFLEVIPLYVRAGCAQGASRPPRGVVKPFLLTVGSKEIRKNYLRSIEAFAKSNLTERGYSYVFCGARANGSAAIEALARTTRGVRSLGYLDDAELRWLYRHASGFVLPSLLEGFGMPALEAAQHGLLSVISHEGALPEAVGEGAILVDPARPDEIAAGMLRLVDMPTPERESRLSIARRHAAELSFDRYLASWSALLEKA